MDNEDRIFELDERNHQCNVRKGQVSDIQYFIDKYVASSDSRDLNRAKACCEILCGQLKIDEIKRSIEAKADRFKKDEKRRKSVFDRRKNNKEKPSDG